ncbi:ParB/RepB/Spo0J family partition protein [Escherichia coli]
MNLDLTGLDQLTGDSDSGSSAGKILDLDVNKVTPDPNQPRIDVANDPELPEMVETVKARGVKVPISVRANPDKPGHWIINFGERRYLATRMAGKKTIPAYVDEEATDYDQVNENLKRKALSAYEMARFINKKLEEGAKKKEIAEKLGVSNSFISEHLKLWQSPDFVLELARSGSIGGKTLYMLAAIDKKHEAELRQFIADANGDASLITRSSVSAFIARLNNPESNPDEQASGATENASNTQGQQNIDAAPQTASGATETASDTQGQQNADAAPQTASGATESGSDTQGQQNIDAAPQTASGATESGSDTQGQQNIDAAPQTASGATESGSDTQGQQNADAAPQTASGATESGSESESSTMYRVQVGATEYVAVIVGKVKVKLLDSNEEIEINADQLR